MNIAERALGHSIEAYGVKTNYLKDGAGFPLVLLHGSGLGVSAHANWGGILPDLARHFQVIAPDVAGFGYSEPKDDTQYSMEFWVAHTVAFLDALEIKRASFIGNSFGGALAVALAARHPERVERMMLMGSAGVHFVPPPVFGFDLSKGLNADTMRQIVNMFTVHPERVTEDMVQIRLQMAVRPGAMARLARLFPGDTKVTRVTSLITDDALIASIKVPTLLVHGRDDQIVPTTTSYRLHELISAADLCVLSRCGHWSQVDRAADFKALAINFLAQKQV